MHFLLLRGHGSRLAAYYPSVVEQAREPDDASVPAFEAFVAEHEARLRPILTERRTQTNAVGRCAALYPAFAHVIDRLAAQSALIELGASAGLNFYWDRYAYDYDGTRVGVADSPVVIACGLRGSGPPLPADPPAVHSRVGLDLNPLDPSDPADADWLRALVWPEHAARRRRLDGALEIAAGDPPRVVAGDAVERLLQLVGDIPAGVPVCLFPTLFAYQLSEAARERLHDRLRTLGTERELYWVASAVRATRTSTPSASGTVMDGGLETTQLGAFEAHGRWLRWAPGS